MVKIINFLIYYAIPIAQLSLAYLGKDMDPDYSIPPINNKAFREHKNKVN